jgi:hypothetical protein
MMNQIDITTIYLIILFILPGYLVFAVINALYKTDKQIKEIEVTYRSLLYSSIIYGVLIVACKARGIDIRHYSTIHPLRSFFIPFVLSFVLIVIMYLDRRFNIFITIGGWLNIAAEVPPNIYATLLDPKFQERAANGYWITYNKNGVIKEGFCEFTDVAGNKPLIYVTDIKEVDQQHNVIRQYDEPYGEIIDLSLLDGLEIKYNE